MRRRSLLLPARVLVGVAATALAVTACAPQDVNDSAAASGSAASCAPSDLQTTAAGKLTIATDEPVYEPWFVDDDPTNQQGFESAVAYAVAQQLGYPTDQVSWVRATFNSVIQPGVKNYDFDINEFSITDERKQAVDFSSSYYDVAQAVITTKGSKADGATSLAALRGLKLGAQVGTTSYDALTNVIKPDSDPAVFNTNDDAKLALKNGQVDAIVVDLPTAFYITSAELDDGVIVGQVADSGGASDQFGLVLTKDSALTSCVTTAVDALRQNGTLDALEQQWLSQVGNAPELS